MNAQWIHEALFLGKDDICNLDYLVRRVKFFRKNFRLQRHDVIVDYLVGSSVKGGRHRRLSAIDDELLSAIIKDNNHLTDRELARLFGIAKTGNPYYIGTSVLRRGRLRTKHVLLTYDRYHAAADKKKQQRHHDICAETHEDCIINYDEVRMYF